MAKSKIVKEPTALEIFLNKDYTNKKQLFAFDKNVWYETEDLQKALELKKEYDIESKRLIRLLLHDARLSMKEIGISVNSEKYHQCDSILVEENNLTEETISKYKQSIVNEIEHFKLIGNSDEYVSALSDYNQLYDKLNRDEYKNKLPYPEWNRKDNESKQMIFLHRKEEARIDNEFRTDCIAVVKAIGVNNKIAEKVYSLAYERGHSSGYSEVINCLIDYFDLLEQVVESYMERK